MEDDDFNNRSGVLIVDTEEITRDLTLCVIFNRFIADIFFPNQASHAHLLPRIKSSVSFNAPLLGEASRNTVRNVLLWTQQGSPVRAVLVVSVGTIASLTLTGMFVFMLFFAAATLNAVIISFLVSLAAAGGFMAMLFALVAAIYVGALTVAIFTISTATIFALVTVLIAAGWVGFFITLCLVAKKSTNLAKHSFSATGSALSAWHQEDLSENSH